MNLSSAFQDIVNQRRSIRIYDSKAPFDSKAVTRSLHLATLAPNSSNLQLWEFYHIKSEEAKKAIATYCLGQPAATTASELVVFVTRKDYWKSRATCNLDKVLDSFETNSAKSSSDVGNTLQSIGKDKEQRKLAVKHYYQKLIPQLYTHDYLGIFGYIKKLYVTLAMAPKKPAYREVLKQDIRVIAHKSCALAAQTFMLSMTAEGYSTCPMEGFDSKRIKTFLQLPAAAEINMVVSCGVAKPEGLYGKRFRVPLEDVIFER